jgi:FkbM family methyltransferase
MQSFLLPWGEDDQVVAAFDASSESRPTEAKSLLLWKRIIEALAQPALVLDVGAYSGIYSLLASYANPAITCVAFEPSIAAYGRFAHNISLNKLFSRILPFHGAAWSTNSSLTIAHQNGPLSLTSGDGALALSDTADHEETVSAVTLDSLKQLDIKLPGALGSKAQADYRKLPVAAIKIDVEGAELNVLHGAAGILRKDRPFIIAEALTDSAHSDLSDFLQREGYVTEYIPEDNNLIAFPFGYTAFRELLDDYPACSFSRLHTHSLA